MSWRAGRRLARSGGARAVDPVQGRREARIPEHVFGSLVAVVLVDLIWLFFDYQPWQRENSQLMLAIFRSFAGPVTAGCDARCLRASGSEAFQWYFFLVQVLVNAFSCGIFGTLSGLVALKSFRPRTAR